jgi:hypothetical protein
MDANRSATSLPGPFWPRLARAVALLMAAIASHLWLVRAPGAPAPRLPSVAIARATAPAGSVQDRPLTIVREEVFAPAILERAGAGAAPRDGADPRGLTFVAAAAGRSPVSDRGESGLPSVVATSGIALPPHATPDEPAAEIESAHAPAPAITTAMLTPDLRGSMPLSTLRPAVLVLPSAPGRRPEVAGTSASSASDEAADLSRQEEVVRQIVREYTRAFERLDVQAAKVLRPSLDDRALQRAFQQLDGQEFRLAPCGVSIRGQDASARCRANATFRPKVGSRVHLSGEWTFNLSRNDSGWQIVDATIH